MMKDFNCNIIKKEDTDLKSLIITDDTMYDRDHLYSEIDKVLKLRFEDINDVNKQYHPIICVDGCSGSGKTTALQLCASYLLEGYNKNTNNNNNIFKKVKYFHYAS